MIPGAADYAVIMVSQVIVLDMFPFLLRVGIKAQNITDETKQPDVSDQRSAMETRSGDEHELCCNIFFSYFSMRLKQQQ